MSVRPCLGYVLAVAWLVAGRAGAHHSGLYDESHVIELAGTIKAVRWVNPHVRLTVDVLGDDGEPVSWQLEGTSVNALERWGVERQLFSPGESVTARGPVSRFADNAMIAATLQLASGATVVLWPNVASRLGLADTGVPGLFPPPRDGTAMTAEAGIFHVWTPRGRAPLQGLPLTERAEARARDYKPLDDDPALRCEPPGMPAMLDTPYPIEFSEQPDQIVMRFEEWDGVRTIYMRPGGGPPVQDDSPKGVSFGRWEGATLAILTTHIDYPFFDDLGTPQSRGVLVLERYTPSEDGKRLDWVVTVTDPDTFTKPVVKTGYMAYEPGEVIKPYNCTLLED